MLTQKAFLLLSLTPATLRTLLRNRAFKESSPSASEIHSSDSCELDHSPKYHFNIISIIKKNSKFYRLHTNTYWSWGYVWTFTNWKRWPFGSGSVFKHYSVLLLWDKVSSPRPVDPRRLLGRRYTMHLFFLLMKVQVSSLRCNYSAATADRVSSIPFSSSLKRFPVFRAKTSPLSKSLFV